MTGPAPTHYEQVEAGPHPDSDFFTATDLARIHRLTRARIYRLAHDHLWRRRRINGQTRYDYHDAHDTLTTPGH